MVAQAAANAATTAAKTAGNVLTGAFGVVARNLPTIIALTAAFAVVGATAGGGAAVLAGKSTVGAGDLLALSGEGVSETFGFLKGLVPATS